MAADGREGLVPPSAQEGALAWRWAAGCVPAELGGEAADSWLPQDRGDNISSLLACLCACVPFHPSLLVAL